MKTKIIRDIVPPTSFAVYDTARTLQCFIYGAEDVSPIATYGKIVPPLSHDFDYQKAIAFLTECGCDTILIVEKNDRRGAFGWIGSDAIFVAP